MRGQATRRRELLPAVRDHDAHARRAAAARDDATHAADASADSSDSASSDAACSSGEEVGGRRVLVDHNPRLHRLPGVQQRGADVQTDADTPAEALRDAADPVESGPPLGSWHNYTPPPSPIGPSAGRQVGVPWPQAPSSTTITIPQFQPAISPPPPTQTTTSSGVRRTYTYPAK